MGTINYTTRSGEKLTLTAYPYEANWPQVGGVYLFAYVDISGNYIVLYAGKTNNFNNRFSNHEKWEPAKRRGAKLILAAGINSEAKRTSIESALIQELQPPLNEVGLRR